jgi:hypothetical protein
MAPSPLDGISVELVEEEVEFPEELVEEVQVEESPSGDLVVSLMLEAGVVSSPM